MTILGTRLVGDSVITLEDTVFMVKDSKGNFVPTEEKAVDIIKVRGRWVGSIRVSIEEAKAIAGLLDEHLEK